MTIEIMGCFVKNNTGWKPRLPFLTTNSNIKEYCRSFFKFNDEFRKNKAAIDENVILEK